MKFISQQKKLLKGLEVAQADARASLMPTYTREARQFPGAHSQQVHWLRFGYRGDDPSAGSPTETLLRLLLPLSDKVH